MNAHTMMNLLAFTMLHHSVILLQSSNTALPLEAYSAIANLMKELLVSKFLKSHLKVQVQ